MMERDTLIITALNTTGGRQVVYPSSASGSARFIEIDAGRAEYDQSWFWTPEWQARHQEAEEDYREGRFEEFDNMDHFLATL